MSGWLAGALLGLVAASGALLAVHSAPPLRPIRLADRMAPYLADTPPPSRLLAAPPASAPFAVARRLLGPLLSDFVAALERVVGGSSSVRRRMSALNGELQVEDFRLEQLIWGALGLLGGGLLFGTFGTLTGHVNVVLAGLGALGGLAFGVLGRDWCLTRQLRRREQAMLAEFPVLADLLALAVIAGEAPADALHRVCRLTRGELARDLNGALARARAGTPLTTALTELADRTTLDAFGRFLHALAVAVERGTPLADVLRAQATDVREHAKRVLLEAGGRKEISMLYPVVFLLLPVTVLFALYPGLLTLTSLAH